MTTLYPLLPLGKNIFDCQHVLHQMAELKQASYTCLVAGAKQFAT